MTEISIEEISAKWSNLLHEAQVRIIGLEKTNELLRADKETLFAEVQELRAELGIAKLDVLKAQGKQIIDGG